MIRLCLTLASVLLLVACGTPQEQCIRKATSQTRMLNRLIAESQTNLARGYTYRTEERHHFRWMACGPIQPSGDRKSTRLNSSHIQKSRMPSSA